MSSQQSLWDVIQSEPSSRQNHDSTTHMANSPLLSPNPAPNQEAQPQRDRPVIDFVQDIVMGASDGFTVPFALAAGLSSRVSSSRLIVVAVVAELAAGCIAMGLGGYMAAHAENTNFQAEKRKIFATLRDNPSGVLRDLVDILGPLGVPRASIDAIFETLKCDRDRCAKLILKFKLGKDETELPKPFYGAIAVGGSYVVAGTLPMLPYLFFEKAQNALFVSIFIGLGSMLAFGWWKGYVLDGDRRVSALQTALLGAVAATVSYILAGSVE